MGNQNSSETRVRPVFGQLLNEAPTGEPWLPRLLDLAGRSSSLALRLASNSGRLPSMGIKQFFERELPPPSGFLEWLAQHPEQMTWPERKGRKEKYGELTQEYREKLFGWHGSEEQRKAKLKALSEIRQKGPMKSKRQWWAFEGFTHVDCCLETDRLLLLIEGKRTDVLSPTTDWFERRNQLSRNLEVAKEAAADKEYAVLLITEKVHSPISSVQIGRGLPHMSEHDRENLESHYLGSVLWKDVCKVTGLDFGALPDYVGN